MSFLPCFCNSIMTSIFSFSLSRFSLIFSSICRGFFPRTSCLATLVPHSVLHVYNMVKKTAFIKSYETDIMIHKINASYLRLTPVLTQKTLRNVMANGVKMNNAVVYPAAKSGHLFKHFLIIRAGRIL